MQQNENVISYPCKKKEGRVKFGKTGHQQIAKIKMLKIKSRFVDAILYFLYTLDLEENYYSNENEFL
jgi:hypothetical protein